MSEQEQYDRMKEEFDSSDKKPIRKVTRKKSTSSEGIAAKMKETLILNIAQLEKKKDEMEALDTVEGYLACAKLRDDIIEVKGVLKTHE